MIWIGIYWNTWRFEREAIEWLPVSPKTHLAQHQSTHFYARDGQQRLSTVSGVQDANSTWLELGEMPIPLVSAMRWLRDSLESQEYASSWLRHAWQMLYQTVWQDLPPVAGVSGELVRSHLMPPALWPHEADRGLEWAIAHQLRRRYSADELLEWFLNRVILAPDISGIEAASQTLFGLSATELNDGQASQLAWLLAQRIAPVGHVDPSKFVTALEPWVELSPEDLLESVTAGVPDLRSSQPSLASENADFMLLAQEQAAQILESIGLDAQDAFASGLTIITSLDWARQQDAIQHWDRILAAADAAEDSYDSAALVGIDVQEGSIVYMVGAAHQQNAAPAPLWLPFAYLESMRGQSTSPMHASSMLLDIPSHYPHPKINNLNVAARNEDDEFLGPILLSDALNGLRAVPIYAAIGGNSGVANALSIAGRLGWSSLADETPSLGLLTHSGAVSVLDAAYAYATLANRGVMQGWPVAMRQELARPHDPLTILQIKDSANQTLWRYERDQDIYRSPLIDAQLTDLLNRLLRGDDEAVWLDGSSGLSATESSGAWQLWYTPSHVLLQHQMREDGDTFLLSERAREEMHRLTQTFSPKLEPVLSWPRNDALVEQSVCERSGGLANGICDARILPFLPGISPLHMDTHWQNVTVNRLNGYLASEATPEDLRIGRTVFNPPEPARDWWQDRGFATLPIQEDTITTATQSITLQPFANQALRGPIPIQGWFNPVELTDITIAYGAGLHPSEWQFLELETDVAEQSRYTFPMTLALWDAENLNGDFTVRAQAFYEDGRSETHTSHTRLDHQPPSFTLIGEWVENALEIHIQEEANDIQKMEYFIDSTPLGVQVSPPFGFALPPTLMKHGVNLLAVAYDAAGNSSQQTLPLQP